MSLRTCWGAFWPIMCVSGCNACATESRPPAPRSVSSLPGESLVQATVADVPLPAECEAALTPGPGARTWVKTCDGDGRRLVTCWAGRRAVVATCARCTPDGKLARCEAPDVDLPALLERELPAGLARCAGRRRYAARLQIEGKSWVIDTARTPPTVTAEAAGSRRDVDTTLLISRAHLVDLVADSEWDGMRMFFAGRLRIEGDDVAGIDASNWLSGPRSQERCKPDAGE